MLTKFLRNVNLAFFYTSWSFNTFNTFTLAPELLILFLFIFIKLLLLLLFIFESIFTYFYLTFWTNLDLSLIFSIIPHNCQTLLSFLFDINALELIQIIITYLTQHYKIIILFILNRMEEW